MKDPTSPLIDQTKPKKPLYLPYPLTFNLSECVLESCGYAMLHEAGAPKAPVAWIGHDLVAKVMDLC